MRRIIIIVLCAFCTYHTSSSQKNSSFDEKKLRVQWELITNKPKTLSAFTFTNTSKKNFPATGWNLYFNSSRGIDTAMTTGGISLTHYNGDIYKLSPTAEFKELKPKESHRVTYFSRGVLINYTAAPSGMYIVWDDDLEKGYSISEYIVSPIKDSSIERITSEKIYQQNNGIQDIPATQLPKIFPTPVSYKETKGEFILNANVHIITD